MLKKVLIIVYIFLLLFSVFKPVYASVLDDVISDGDSFVSNGGNGAEIVNEDNVKEVSDTIYNMLLLIGMVIAVIVGSIIGIKFMISSVEEKAKIKEILIVYIIGCFVLFGAFSIWKIVISVLGL